MTAVKDSLQRAKEKLQALRDSGVKIVPLDPSERARRNPKSLRLAITGHCWECCGSGDDGKKFTQETVRLCTARNTCSLWPVRPYQTA